jgi:predicted transcriptional regulator with HTH domain
MSNVQRLMIELGGKEYIDDTGLCALLDENGLDGAADYNTQDRRKLLCSVLSIFQILANNIDLYRKVETEFSNDGEALTGINKRITALKSEIAALDKETSETNSCVSYMYCGGR